MQDFLVSPKNYPIGPLIQDLVSDIDSNSSRFDFLCPSALWATAANLVIHFGQCGTFGYIYGPLRGIKPSSKNPLFLVSAQWAIGPNQ